MAHADLGAKTLVEEKQAEGIRWEAVRHPERGYWETLSLTRHPCRIADAAPQTSAPVDSTLQATLAALVSFAPRPQ
jgi:hypothetical protein